MIFNKPAALCAAFLISISANAMSNSSLTLYGGALELECAQNSNRINVTAKTTKQFAAKIKAKTASGNHMNYSFSGGTTMSMGFGVSDLPVEFNVMSNAQETEVFILDTDCQITTSA